MFIMLDGIDGCGKSTIIQAWKDYLTAQGNAIFDLKKYWQETGHYPELSELKIILLFSAANRPTPEWEMSSARNW